MSKSKAQENYIDWVRDAHAMEKQAETMLTKMADRLEHYPLLQRRIQEHIVETQGQQKLVQDVLDRLDTSHSVIKDVAAKATAMGQSLSGMFVSDEVVKGGISGYVFEHFEIACYSALIVAAEAVGDLQGAQTFKTIKIQEEQMAKWLEENLPAVTKRYLALLENPDVDASR